MDLERWFFAVSYNKVEQNQIKRAGETLLRYTEGGRLVSPDRVHVTLAFLGACDSMERRAVLQAMEDFTFPAFTGKVKGFGRFKRREGDLIFLKYSQDPAWETLYQELYRRVNPIKGFGKNLFKPHATLMRKTRYREGEGFTSLAPVEFYHRVREVVLYQSILDPHGAIYRPIKRWAATEI